MEQGVYYKGFTLRYRGLDVFFRTDRKNKTLGLAKAIAHKLNIPDYTAFLKDILYWTKPCEACLEMHRYGGSEELWIDIRGIGYGGYGSKVSDYRAKDIEPVYYI